MAVAELNLSRRALLGAAFALPLSRHPGLDPGSTFFPSPVPEAGGAPDRVRGDDLSRAVTKWDRALARFRNAEAALAAVKSADDDLFDRVLGRFNHALRRLLRAPAPGPAAFSAKLALAIDQEIWELTGGDACLAALVRDARRLASFRSS
jgi:hypothetical protein